MQHIYYIFCTIKRTEVEEEEEEEKKPRFYSLYSIHSLYVHRTYSSTYSLIMAMNFVGCAYIQERDHAIVSLCKCAFAP